jgi:hypothetical protein
MLPESQAAVVARNETWTGNAATEPYEAGWAREAIVFVRALKVEGGGGGVAVVELSPDGMNWAAEGTTFALPTDSSKVTFARVAQFGNWLRIRAELPQGASITVVVTIHVKA